MRVESSYCKKNFKDFSRKIMTLLKILKKKKKKFRSWKQMFHTYFLLFLLLIGVLFTIVQYTHLHYFSQTSLIRNRLLELEFYSNSTGFKNDVKTNECMTEYRKNLWIHEKWPSLKIDDSSVRWMTVIGAHFDDRPVRAPVVRLFAVTSRLKTIDIPSVVKCEISMDNLEKYPARITNVMNIKMSSWHYLVKGSYLTPISFACETEHLSHVLDNTPCHVSLTLANRTEVVVPVTYPREKTDSSNMVGICVGALYGHMDEREARALVEWVEINLMFGVSEINMYNSSVTAPALVQRVFDYYKLLGVLTWTDFPPSVSTWQQHELYDAAIISNKISLCDCITRNRLRYTGILVHDYDELIVPEKLWSDTNVTQEVMRNEGSILSTGFPVKMVFLDIAPITNNSQTKITPLITEKYQHAVPDRSRYTKVLVNPQNCALLHPHNCILDVDNSNIFIEESVQPSYPRKAGKGTLYHFRRSCSQKYTDLPENSTVIFPRGNIFGLNCTKVEMSYKSDAVLSELNNYQKEIKTRVQQVLKKLDLINAPNY